MAGISRQVDDKNLETKVLPIFQTIGYNIDPTFIDDCHRISKNNDRVIVKFTCRKDCKQILKVKKDLRNLDMDDLDLPSGTKIYISQRLCLYYRILWSKAKRLQNIGSIDNFYISSGTIKIKVTENSSPITITRLDDFKIHFSDIDLSPPTDASKFRVHIMFCFFFYLGFLSRTFTIHGAAGEGGGYLLTPVYHFHPLHRHLDISRAIAAESSPLHIAGSRTRTRNLWFPSASR